MLLSVSEVDLLRLLRWCRYLPEQEVCSVFSADTVEILLQYRLIGFYRGFGCYVLTQRGNAFLDEQLPAVLPPAVRPAYQTEDYLRRARTARLALTAYRAGLSVFLTDPAVLEENGSCYLTAIARCRGKNPWGSSRMAALLRIGDLVCGAYYVGKGIGGIDLANELGAFRNSTARLKKVVPGLIYTGESYESILSELEREDDTASKRTSYRDAFQRLTYPVFLLPFGEVGAQQLAMMRRADYRQRMVKAALGNAYRPPPPDRPAWDAIFKGTALVMAADMDFKRIEIAIDSAGKDGLPPPYLVSLKGQERVLLKRYKSKGLAGGVFMFNAEKPEIRREIGVYTPPDRPFTTEEGGVIRAPLIKDHRRGRK